MNYFFVRLVHPWIMITLATILAIALYVRKKYHQSLLYKYSLADELKKSSALREHPHRIIIKALRVCSLLLLACASGGWQIIDSRSKVSVHGIDIVLVLDVSGSMNTQDNADDRRSRFDIAKEEAIRFIKKRDQDAIGLVLFGNDTLSRCPITSDKLLLEQVVRDTVIGEIDHQGTMLVRGMVTAVNRLKHSSAKTKVMILLTDGEPSEGDMNPAVGIDIAQKLGIKIYTIGIGSEEDRIEMTGFFGARIRQKVNKELLTKIATETGGQYFLASNAADMRRIYDSIDKLEKTEHEVPLFSVYYDMGTLFMCFIAVCLMVELLLSTFVWFAL